MGLRYIGSKARVADRIIEVAGPPRATFVDAMAGTGSVAASAARAGWPVRVNDHLYGSSCVAVSRVLTSSDVPFAALGGYTAALDLLKTAPSVSGPVHRHYSPATAGVIGHERRYFTEQNAVAIDGYRAQIAAWANQGAITPMEERLLLADLIEAANGVANTAGTYGCYLRHWTPVALRPVNLRPRTLMRIPVVVEIYNADVQDVPVYPDDTAYYDPPYTKRQYAAYYHLQETIAHGDEPEVGGVTGLRPWRDLASDFCYRTKALDAIVRLVDDCPANRVLLSYSDEGHVPRADLETVLRPLGELRVHDLGEIGRYRPNAPASVARSAVQEVVFEVRRPPAALPPRQSAHQEAAVTV